MSTKDISTSWDRKYLNLAKEVSSWSKDPSTKVGAVAVGNIGHILATGYNGFPRGIADTQERYDNRELKYKYVVHAEMNCIYNATHNGVSLNGATLYVWGLPVCSECAKGIVQVGIDRIVIPVYNGIPTKWKDSFEETRLMFEEANIQIDEVEIEN